MKISTKSNKLYNALINNIRKQAFPDVKPEHFREDIKKLNHLFPTRDGKCISMSEIEIPDFEKHLQFVKAFAIARGATEGISEKEIQMYRETFVPITLVSQERLSNGVDVVLTCSKCGAVNRKLLKIRRFLELKEIITGARKESSELTDNFWCLDCYLDALK